MNPLLLLALGGGGLYVATQLQGKPKAPVKIYGVQQQAQLGGVVRGGGGGGFTPPTPPATPSPSDWKQKALAVCQYGLTSQGVPSGASSKACAKMAEAVEWTKEKAEEAYDWMKGKAEQAYGELKEWFGDAWDDVEEFFGDIGEEIGDAASEAWDAITPW